MATLTTADALLKTEVRSDDHILLVNPPVEDTRYSWLRWNQPLDLLRIGAFLREHVGCKVSLLDFMKPDRKGKVMQQRVPGSRGERIVGGERYPMRRFGLPYRTMGEWLVDRRGSDDLAPTQIWVTSLCSYWYQSVAQVCREAIHAAPEVKLALLGNYARLASNEAAEACPVDYVVADSTPLEPLPAAFDLYGEYPPPFLAVELEPETAVQEIRDAVERGIYHFTFFTEDVCVEGGAILHDIVARTKGYHKNLRFHIICGLSPRHVTPEVAGLLADPVIAEFHFEEESNANGELDTECYLRAIELLKQAGMQLPSKRLNAFLWIGKPAESLDSIVSRCFTMLQLVGNLILKPFSPTPGSSASETHHGYVRSIASENLSPHLFPFAELNGLTRHEYSDLYRMAAFLTDKVRGTSFDFFDGTLGAKLLRDSLKREVWNIGATVRTTD